jgi:hypothetical protein
MIAVGSSACAGCQPLPLLLSTPVQRLRLAFTVRTGSLAGLVAYTLQHRSLTHSQLNSIVVKACSQSSAPSLTKRNCSDVKTLRLAVGAFHQDC